MNQFWILPLGVQDEMLRDGRQRYPMEACGLLFGTFDGRMGGRIERYLPVANHSKAPHHAFELDPSVWVRSCFDPRLIGLYHTHPSSLPLPSREDLLQLPNFAARIHLYMIGGRLAQEYNKPPGEPDGFRIHAYGIDSHDGDYALFPVKLEVGHEGK
ncbi:Mov34/MPN/PAD-1 family protein [Paenibacillus timonensis]|uniref:Mov34/MPN/PAD-1 family protein n=2 Tax=Paenibacillus TaxID=44249 RepID=A0ABW3SGY4_9BACL|nr:Mov34/MPN/PAD-1 family protein [Paenibacillus timonensis]MCH1642418.1 Mov34/MPN/PAD-1 family protein [Paenibacillus timonensis]